MHALVYHGPDKKSWEQVVKPVLMQTTDAIVRILKTTICGTDLHIMKGDLPEVKEGRILGHEGVGIIEEVGSSVSNFKKGDHVIISCVTYCKKGMYSHYPSSLFTKGKCAESNIAELRSIPIMIVISHFRP